MTRHDRRGGKSKTTARKNHAKPPALAPAPIPEVIGTVVTKAELVKRFGETPKQIERYLVEGIPCTGQGKTRRFPWPAVRHWRDERIRRQERERLTPKSEAPQGFKDAELRSAIADAELKELKLAQLRGDLVQVTDYRQELADALARVRSSLLRHPALPPVVADDLLRGLQAEPPPVEDPEPAVAA